VVAGTQQHTDINKLVKNAHHALLAPLSYVQACTAQGWQGWLTCGLLHKLQQRCICQWRRVVGTELCSHGPYQAPIGWQRPLHLLQGSGEVWSAVQRG
jgi:hypothetical protein